MNIEDMLKECGEDFRTLILHTQYRKKLAEPWEAVPNKKRVPDIKGQKGKTAEEALGKLLKSLKHK